MSACIWGNVGVLNVGALGYSHLRRKEVSGDVWRYNDPGVLTDRGYIRLVATVIESQPAVQDGV